MNIEIIDKLNEITKIIDNDKELIKYKKLKEEILNDQELLDKIKKLKEIDSYGKEYLDLKSSILSNEKYNEYIKLENKLFFDIKDINMKLNELVEKSGCK